MEISDELRRIMDLAESLKSELWFYMDSTKKTHEGVKKAMNELLDLIEEIDECYICGRVLTPPRNP